MAHSLLSPDLDLSALPSAVAETLVEFLESRRELVYSVDDRFGDVFKSLQGFVLNGGKRVRPAFAWIGWLGANGAAGDEDPEAVFRAVSSLELIQACALIHDDIIDSSDTRRGSPTVHRQFEQLHSDNGWIGSPSHYGESIAIIAGDVALAWADDMFHASGLSDAARNRARDPWWRMRTEVLGGQVLDITSEASGDTDLRTAEKINRFKTAAYTIERPLLIGAAIAHASPEIVEAYRAYGRDIGIAFQLRDDQLGVFGDPAITGKPAGDDLREGKRTVLVSTALSRLQEKDPAGAAHLEASLGTVADPDDIARLTELVRSSGAEEELEDMIQQLTRRGVDALKEAPILSEYRQTLTDMADLVTQRAL